LLVIRESLRKLFVAMSQDIRVLIIKLADRLHNIKTLQYVRPEKQLRIAKETLEIYAPIANRLGIKKIQRELEDTAFPYVFPEDYERIKKLFTVKRDEQEERLNKFQNTLKKELAREGVIDFRMDHRIKGLYSLYKKLKKRDWDFEEIYDISALRIIVRDIPECYRILGIIHGAWRPLPGKIKDNIAYPRPSGYRSLHTTVFTGDGGIVEIQIRTEEMHKEAEYGIASHMTYKEGQKKSNVNIEWIKNILPSETKPGGQHHRASSSDIPQWVKELVEYQKNAGDEFIDEIKSDFFEERIFVFTPEGDVIDLPAESSVVDFAYAIHSDIGNHMAGAKINGKMVSIDTKLSGGDRVEIITKKSAKPSGKWLDYCKTTMARRHIRNEIEKK
jgi:GTP pyrophosphokinase